MFLSIAKHALKLLLTLALGGLLAATLVRFAPGFGLDEERLDIRLNNQSIEALTQQPQENLGSFYLHYCERLLHGDLGMSHTLQRPVSELIRERLPETLKSVTLGLLLAWALGLSLGCVTVMSRSFALDTAAGMFCGALLCIPAAVMALIFVLARAPERLALAVVLFPKIYSYCRNLLLRSMNQTHILTARAKGLGNFRLLSRHVLWPAVPQLLAVAGVSAGLAFTAAIPIEALCDLPGVGQLAWKAAMGRDLYLLITLTFLVTAVTLVANSMCELLGNMLSARQS
ncbi:MAG TPA: ABC transporter permease [Terriglobales bacterium]|nr:ABC transporter permease [Terriglobales bacterium]